VQDSALHCVGTVRGTLISKNDYGNFRLIFGRGLGANAFEHLKAIGFSDVASTISLAPQRAQGLPGSAFSKPHASQVRMALAAPMLSGTRAPPVR
jgi:hypothetical protein